MTSGSSRRSWLRNLGFLVGFSCAVSFGSAVHAQIVQRVVGGVSIDADGVVQRASLTERDGLLAELRQSVHGAKGDIAKANDLRMISLRKLQAAIIEQQSSGQPLSEDIQFLAGLQRIEYVFVYPEEKDIVIAGPAEGWKVRAEDGAVVGSVSGRPVIRLEDLMVAFRTVDAARNEPISVSIDPTEEGSQRLNQVLRSLAGANAPTELIDAKVREAFGPQHVKFTTVSTGSRMAQTLVAADYRMKLLAMNHEEAPVAGLPSYMEMIRTVRLSRDTQPRWWIACEYDAIRHTDDSLAWKLDGRGVKAMTEEELVTQDGARSSAKGSQNKFAQKWADLFTEKFDELCKHNSSFGELRNVMDMNVVATLIAAQQLDKSAGLDLGVLRGTKGDIEATARVTPKTIPAHCSLIKGVGGMIVAASGGVEINPWQIVVQKQKSDATLASKRVPIVGASNWWW